MMNTWKRKRLRKRKKGKYLPVRLDFHSSYCITTKKESYEKVIVCESIQLGKFPLYLASTTEANAIACITACILFGVEQKNCLNRQLTYTLLLSIIQLHWWKNGIYKIKLKMIHWCRQISIFSNNIS
jgi:hypothetical protein